MPEISPLFSPTRRGWFATAAAAVSSLLSTHRPVQAAPSQDVYARLGLRPVINFRGTHTTIGASKIWPEIHEAMAQASRQYIVLEELQEEVGKRLAALIGTEDAMVTTGAAGAILIGTAATIAGQDPTMIRTLPNISGPRRQVLIQKAHRNGYDHAVRNNGVDIVEYSSVPELEAAAAKKPVMIYVLGGTSHDYKSEVPVSLEEILRVAKPAGIPVMVDAANMLPPWSNLQMLAKMGVDLIASSGGKHMRGPQCSGILAGRADLIKAAWLNSSPHSDSIGRPAKVGREEVIGCWLAAEQYASLDFEKLDREREKQAAYIMSELKRLPGIKIQKAPFDRTRHVHRVMVHWSPDTYNVTSKQVEQELMEGEPRIAIARDGEGIELTVFMNDPGEEKIAAKRVREVLLAHRSAAQPSA